MLHQAKAMARAGPAREWGKSKPGKQDLLRVLTAQVDESYDIQLRLIKAREVTKARNQRGEERERELAQDRAERQRAREVKTREYVKRKREAKDYGARYRWKEGMGRVWQWDDQAEGHIGLI